jgi:hypothetical protein
MSITRRQVLKRASAALAAPVLLQGCQQQNNPTPQDVPSIQLDLAVNLDTDDVYNFLSSTKPEETFGPVLSDSEKTVYTHQLSIKEAGSQSFPKNSVPKCDPLFDAARKNPPGCAPF